MTIQQTRIQPLNDLDNRKGDYVLYWMQQSQRAKFNHALDYAIQQAAELDQGLLVAFGLTADYPEANLRHYTFMLEGLKETRTDLASMGIKMVLRLGDPPDVALKIGRRASMIVCDRGYLRHQKKWRQQVAKEAACPVVQVESDVIVPVEVVSDKPEYAARTIRPKIHQHLEKYLSKPAPPKVKHSSLSNAVEGLDLNDIEKILKKMDLDRSVAPVSVLFQGGTSQAVKRFDAFVRNGLENYIRNSNQPQTDDISHMSPYLHFGQISPLYLALKIQHAQQSPQEAQKAFLEELIVRRELAVNFTHYTANYEAYDCIPGWARKTLAEHRKDKREYVYGRQQLE